MDEKSPSESPEIANPVQIEYLPGNLGFIENAELSGLRPMIIEAMRSGNHTAIKALLSQYQEKAEKLVEEHEGDAYDRAQIGLIVATGLLWREAGKPVSYGVELWNARNYANNMHYDDVVAVLDFAYSKVQRFVEASEASAYIGPPTPELIAVCKKELPAELHEELDRLAPLPPDEALEQIAALIYGADSYGSESEEPYDFFQRMGWMEPQTETEGQ